MPPEFRRLGLERNLVCSVNSFVREFASQENRRLRNPKIGRPLRRLIHTAQQRRVFFWREISVKSCAELRMHVREGWLSEPSDLLLPFLGGCASENFESCEVANGAQSGKARASCRSQGRTGCSRDQQRGGAAERALSCGSQEERSVYQPGASRARTN